MQSEQQKSMWIFGRRILPRLEMGNEVKCREATEDVVVVIKAVDNYGVEKCICRRGGF